MASRYRPKGTEGYEAQLQYNQKWRDKNRELMRAADAKSRARLKDDVFDHYGRKCACCGESEFIFLTIDHVNDDGAEHRRSIGRTHTYSWLRQNGYPEGFQTLCWNCQWGKRLNGGVCPHAEPKSID